MAQFRFQCNALSHWTVLCTIRYIKNELCIINFEASLKYNKMKATFFLDFCSLKNFANSRAYSLASFTNKRSVNCFACFFQNFHNAASVVLSLYPFFYSKANNCLCASPILNRCFSKISYFLATFLFSQSFLHLFGLCMFHEKFYLCLLQKALNFWHNNLLWNKLPWVFFFFFWNFKQSYQNIR